MSLYRLSSVLYTEHSVITDLLDNMYELVDSLTFKLRAIAPNMWPVFELTYKLFKSDAVDFLDGQPLFSLLHVPFLNSIYRDAAVAGQLCLVWQRCLQSAR